MNEQLSKAVAAEVRACLARQNVKRAEFAQALSMCPGTLRHTLRGRRPFHLDEVAAAAQYFGVPVAALLPAWAHHPPRGGARR